MGIPKTYVSASMSEGVLHLCVCAWICAR